MRILKDEGCFRENYCVGGDSASSACSPEVTRRRPRGCSKNYFKVSLMVNAAEIVEKEMKQERSDKDKVYTLHEPEEALTGRGYRGKERVGNMAVSIPSSGSAGQICCRKREARKKSCKRAGTEPVVGHLKIAIKREQRELARSAEREQFI